MATVSGRPLVVAVDARPLVRESFGELLLLHRSTGGWKAYRVQLTRHGISWKLMRLSAEVERAALERLADRAAAAVALTPDGAALLHLNE